MSGGADGGTSVSWDFGRHWPGRVGKTIKGMFVALALVLTLTREHDPLATLLALVGAVLAFAVGELYEGIIEERIRGRRSLRATEFRAIAVEQSFIFVGAVPAMVIYAFATGGLISSSAADNITLWTGVALLGGLGALAGRMAGEPPVRCLGYGAESAVVGALIVVLKVAVKKI
jgi:hypothetical protein